MIVISVLKKNRTISKSEFVNVSNQIYVRTINFLSRLSSRYSRLIASQIADLAGEVMDYSEKANSIFPSDEQRKLLRKEYLIKARASLMALDVRLTHVYSVLMCNPQGAFTTSNSSPLDSSSASKRIDHMAEFLGNLINEENALLTGAIKSINSR